MTAGGVRTTSPENELLLLASHRYPIDCTRQRIIDLASMPIDWPYVLAQALRHGVAPLLYWNLGNATAGAVPSQVVGELAALHRSAANRNLYLWGELLKIIARLERVGIPAIPLKGPVLAVTAFGDVSLRAFSDLDILIHERDIARTCYELAGAGFHCRPGAEWHEPYLRFGHELDFFRREDGAYVDLQWRFAKKWLGFPLDPDAMWDRAVVSSIGDARVRQPCLEDSLIILCGHAYRHCWSHLKWITDVAAFMHRFGTEIDWPALVHRVRADGGDRMLMLGLWLAQTVGGTPLPSAVRPLVRSDCAVEKLGRSVVAGLFDDMAPIGARGSTGLLGAFSFHWQARERVGDKLPIIKPLLAHGGYLARRYATRYARRLFASRALAR